jgi:acetyl esterase/lipase
MTTAGREQLRHLGADLAGRGIAVWSIGYRRADEPGGGYPGTFLDVAQAIDQARREAQRHRFNLGRTVLIGHSAGGHLALWAAARAEIPAPGPLASADPFVPSTIIALAGVGDLERFAPFVPLFCGQGIIEALTRGRTDYADVSPAALPLPEARIVLVSGTLDRLVPPYVAHDYASAHGLAGAERIERVDIAGAGHFDLVTPGTQAWQIVSQRIVQAVSPPVPQVSR